MATQARESDQSGPLIGVLALQGAFEEHQASLEAVGCRTVQVRTPHDLGDLDGIVLPGGESTAMGLLGTTAGTKGSSPSMWEALQQFPHPMWGTCAGMILLAEKCIGTSAVITDGQSLIGGVNITVCRNYFGSQISSFEMATPPPPGQDSVENFPGVFIRAPAILSASAEVEILGKVVAPPCRQAAVTLAELERKIAAGENVVKVCVADALDRSNNLAYKLVLQESGEEKKDEMSDRTISLPGAAQGTNAREVICAVRKDNLLCTAFHPELTDDVRWHQYFKDMVVDAKSS